MGKFIFTIVLSLGLAIPAFSFEMEWVDTVISAMMDSSDRPSEKLKHYYDCASSFQELHVATFSNIRPRGQAMTFVPMCPEDHSRDSDYDKAFRVAFPKLAGDNVKIYVLHDNDKGEFRSVSANLELKDGEEKIITLTNSDLQHKCVSSDGNFPQKVHLKVKRQGNRVSITSAYEKYGHDNAVEIEAAQEQGPQVEQLIYEELTQSVQSLTTSLKNKETAFGNLDPRLMTTLGIDKPEVFYDRVRRNGGYSYNACNDLNAYNFKRHDAEPAIAAVNTAFTRDLAEMLDQGYVSVGGGADSSSGDDGSTGKGTE